MVPPSARLLLLLSAALLAGCETVVLNPSGDIAAQQGKLVVVSTLLMLLIIVPVIALTVLFAWRYRQTNKAAEYDPEWDHSTKLEVVIWGAPILIIIALGLLTWFSTHRLDPYKPLERIDASRPLPADVKPLEVQVVSMDWKWLFIYPEQGVASVNKLVTPVDVPIRFKLTSSTVMNAFYIPALAGQIYTMAGMETTLHAVMNKPGVYEGFSSNYSGDGFSQMRFKYHGVTAEEFDQWVQTAKTEASNKVLDRAAYLELDKPSQQVPPQDYGKVEPELFAAVVNRCVAPNTMCMHHIMAADAKRTKEAIEGKHKQKPAGEEADADHHAAHGKTRERTASHHAMQPRVEAATHTIH
ncbi:MAG: ubiquinol oxidase subunit II [Burkholderiaceae bacterium]